MYWRAIRMFMGFCSGYLYITWFSIPEPFNFEEFLSGIILEPLQFFAAGIAFIAAFLMHAAMLRDAVALTVDTRESQNKDIPGLLFSYSSLLSLAILLVMETAAAVPLFGFSFIYGMISIDFSEIRKNKQTGW
ncbi:hypothetical protein [Peribacillus sp. SCS-37]|uniref:hypothetical protein n=1 Tax=Paraperibacillus esterisolvens TaxID=3115296 RepID=UPI0039057A82